MEAHGNIGSRGVLMSHGNTRGVTEAPEIVEAQTGIMTELCGVTRSLGGTDICGGTSSVGIGSRGGTEKSY